MSEESPLFPLRPQETISVTRDLLKSALPASLAQLTNFATGLISIRFVGKHGNPPELAGFSIGLSIISLLCFGLCLSLDQGFAILASKLFGAKKYREMGVLYYRHLFIVAAISISIIFALSFCDRILLSLGLNPDVSMNAGVFLGSMIPSIIGSSLFSSTRYFLVSQNIFGAPSLILWASIPAHYILCHFFVDSLGMPVAGVGFAKSITDVTAAILLGLYIRSSNSVSRETLVPWTRECLENLGSHLKRTLLLGITSCLELIVFEVSVLIISALNNPLILGAHGVAINLVSIVFCLPLGIGLSMQAKIGNAIGQGYKEKVKKILAGGIILNLIFSLLSVMIFIVFSKKLSSFFVDDQVTSEMLQNMLLIYGLAHIPDSYANIIGAVLRAIGKERQVLGAFLLCYMGFGLSGQWIFGLLLGYGYIAVWVCTAAATFLMCGFVLYQAWALDWKQQIERVKRAFDQQIYAETQSLIEFADIS